jgi:hypothetical protein
MNLLLDSAAHPMVHRGRSRSDHPERVIYSAIRPVTVRATLRAKDEAMSNGENRSSRPHFRAAPLITSAAMVGGGTMIALAGLAVGGGHLLSTTRQWLNEMEVRPSELARIKWTQARAAMSAGAQAWQNGSGSMPARAGT